MRCEATSSPTNASKAVTALSITLDACTCQRIHCAGTSQQARSQNVASTWPMPSQLPLQVLFHRAIKTRRFESLSMQDITQFIIVGLLCGAPHTGRPAFRCQPLSSAHPRCMMLTFDTKCLYEYAGVFVKRFARNQTCHMPTHRQWHCCGRRFQVLSAWRIASACLKATTGACKQLRLPACFTTLTYSAEAASPNTKIPISEILL